MICRNVFKFQKAFTTGIGSFEIKHDGGFYEEKEL